MHVLAHVRVPLSTGEAAAEEKQGSVEHEALLLLPGSGDADS